MDKLARVIDEQTIEVLDLSQFDVASILHSGQIFRYFVLDNNDFELVVGKNYASLRSFDDKVVIKCNDVQFFWDYFDLNTDYNIIKNELLRFEGIRPAIEAGGGIRILKSDFNEMVISFIISANNNIKRFTKTLNTLAERFGDRLLNGRFAFPTLEQLSCVTADDFKGLGAGYRASYLVKAVKQLHEIDIERLKLLDNAQLDKALMSIQGVGPKVCACIKLFCGKLHRIDCCPVDTWILKALRSLGDLDRVALLNHPYAGIAQQYIFYFLQHLGGELG